MGEAVGVHPTARGTDHAAEFAALHIAAVVRARSAAVRLARLVEDRDRIGLGSVLTRRALARAERRLAALAGKRQVTAPRLAAPATSPRQA